MVCTGKNLDFFKICFTNRILPNHSKSCKWVVFKTLLCQTTWFQMNLWCTLWKYMYIVSYNFGQKKFSKSKIHILPIYGQTDAKPAKVRHNSSPQELNTMTLITYISHGLCVQKLAAHLLHILGRWCHHSKITLWTQEGLASSYFCSVASPIQCGSLALLVLDMK